MTARSNILHRAPADFKPLIVLSGDPHIIRPIQEWFRPENSRARIEIVENGLGPFNAAYFHRKIKEINISEKKRNEDLRAVPTLMDTQWHGKRIAVSRADRSGAYCVLHYEFSEPPYSSPIVGVDSIGANIYHPLYGFSQTVMCAHQQPIMRSGYGRVKGFNHQHDPLYKVVEKLKQDWKRISEKCGIDLLEPVIGLIDRYVRGGVDIPLTDFVRTSLQAQSFSVQTNEIIEHYSRFSFHELERCLRLDIPNEKELRLYSSLDAMSKASRNEKRIPVCSIDVVDCAPKDNLIVGLAEGITSWLQFELEVKKQRHRVTHSKSKTN